jgi:hypothetical protein
MKRKIFHRYIERHIRSAKMALYDARFNKGKEPWKRLQCLSDVFYHLHSANEALEKRKK